MDRLFTFKEIAERTSTSVAFWRKLAARRAIAVVRLGRACRISETELERFVTERCRPARQTDR